MASNVKFEDLQAQNLAHAPPTVDVISATRRATREWVEGPETPMRIATEKVMGEDMEAKKAEHTVEHLE